MMPPLPRGTGPTPFGLQGLPHRWLAASPHQMRWIDDDDLLASIDRHGQSLAECLSLAKSALAMVRCRSPPVVDLVEDRLAKAEARIAGEIPVVTSTSFQFCLQDSDHLPI